MTVILGIDPGSRITGYGLIRSIGNEIKYIDSGCIRTTTDTGLSGRLLDIFDGIRQIMAAFKPDEVAVEQVFMHQNVNTALKLGHARGVAMVAAASPVLAVAEYSPREVKKAVAGYGAADKEQVKQMVMRLLMLSKAPQIDASDALAVAICHSHAKQSNLFRSKCI
ncbi:MAG: crossover junction endodeoxyribonuclease RuvC [Gammaproteobacteria bacterium]|nr:crossover junction endodeoxyribonuclease RuvC [Gammaproteobacteria bacterium]MCH9762621.1 crossover junction endodeoxyribonuclease RuvC [Gammaproteobacteria bacterium]